MSLFETIGQWFFQPKRPPLFFGLLALPALLAFYALFTRHLALQALEERFDASALKGKAALEKRLAKESFLKRYSVYEPYFINRHLETVPLLQEELKAAVLQHAHPACLCREQLQKRIQFLEGSENRLSFAEEALHSSPRIRETEEKLLHPVEVDRLDLAQILSLVEGVPIGGYTPHPLSPQLIVKDFSLAHQGASAYELNLNLLKREFLSHEALRH